MGQFSDILDGPSTISLSIIKTNKKHMDKNIKQVHVYIHITNIILSYIT